VIDPTKVTRCALENAASISVLMLTTESVDVPETPSTGRGHGLDMDESSSGAPYTRVILPPKDRSEGQFSEQREAPQNRHINAWIVDGEPPLEKGRTYKFAINVGKLCEHANIAAPKLREFDWKDNQELEVWVVLSGSGIMAEPHQQKFTLPKQGDTDPIFFAVTPTGYGSVLLRISLYFARELTLLQEFEVPIAVKGSIQVA
jgi:hypothetical protein